MTTFHLISAEEIDPWSSEGKKGHIKVSMNEVACSATFRMIESGIGEYVALCSSGRSANSSEPPTNIVYRKACLSLVI